MKFFFDRNWSPHLAAALHVLCAPHGDQVVHHDTIFPRDCPDIDWITKLGREGGWVIVTKDRLTKNVAEREALRRSGLVAFIFTSQWSHQKEWDQAWALVRWWPRITSAATLMRDGAFMVPFRYSGTGKIAPVKL